MIAFLKKHFDNLMVLVGIGAFVLACLLFTKKPEKRKLHYIDWGINVKNSCVQLLSNERTILIDSLSKTPRVQIIGKKTKNNPIADTIERKLFLLDHELKKITTTWDSAFTIPKNSSFNQSILIMQDSLFNLGNNYKSFNDIPFYYEITDTSKYVKSYTLNGVFSPSKTDSLRSHIDLFRKYPSTAFWVVLSIAQFVFWIITIGICLSLFYNFRQEILKSRIQSHRQVLIVNAFVTFIALVVFIIALFYLLYDRKFNFDEFFYGGFTRSMIVYSLFGYFSAFLFLYGFLLTGYYVRQSNVQLTESVKALNQLKLSAQEKNEHLLLRSYNLSGEEQDKIKIEINAIQKSAEQKASEVMNLKDNFLLCTRYFRFFFLISAILLSVLVIWLGSLFAAVNSIDLFKFYKSGTGINFLQYDFVYLYGGVHTLLLFIFYIPVKMRLMGMSFAIPESNSQSSDGASIKKFLNNFFSRFIEIITASSPLLTALLQKLIDG